MMDARAGGIAVPPSDPAAAWPDPINPDDLGAGPAIVGVSWTLTALCILFITLRFYIRIVVKHDLSSDDWIILAAVILQVVSQGLVTKAYYCGMGKHDVDMTFDELTESLKYNWISTIPGICVSILARISAAILLIRIFGSKLWLKWFLIVFTPVQSIVAMVLIVVVWVQCNPVEGLWNPFLPATRWDPKIQQSLALLGQSLFTFSDLTYVLFPVIIIWKLNMPLRRKLALCGIMAMSLFTMAMSITKTINSQTATKQTTDAAYHASIGILWSAIEQTLVVIMGCLPSLRAITNIDFSAVRSIGGSLASLVGRGSSKTRDTNASSGFGTSSNRSVYYDLEMSTGRLGRLGVRHSEGEETLHGSSAAYYKESSNQSLEAANQIRRTDQFSVTHS